MSKKEKSMLFMSTRTMSRYADKEIKLVLWFYRMHTISYGYYIGFLFCEYLFSFVLLLCSKTCFDSFCSIHSWRFLVYVSMHAFFCAQSDQIYALNYEYYRKIDDETFIYSFHSHTTNLFQSEYLVVVCGVCFRVKCASTEKYCRICVCSVHIYILKNIIMWKAFV